MERGTTLRCAQCGMPFEPKNRNGIPARFCARRCLDRYRNAARLQSVAALKQISPRVRRVDPRKQRIDLAVIPPFERPALPWEAAERLGLTEGAALMAIRRAAQHSALSPQHGSAAEAAV